jgi:hypothetical protein
MAEKNMEYRGTIEHLVEEWWQKKPEIERKLFIAETNKRKYEENNFQKSPVVFVTADGLRGVRDMPYVHRELPLVIDFGLRSENPDLNVSVRRYVYSHRDSTMASTPYVLVYVEEVK